MAVGRALTTTAGEIWVGLMWVAVVLTVLLEALSVPGDSAHEGFELLGAVGHDRGVHSPIRPCHRDTRIRAILKPRHNHPARRPPDRRQLQRITQTAMASHSPTTAGSAIATHTRVAVSSVNRQRCLVRDFSVRYRSERLERASTRICRMKSCRFRRIRVRLFGDRRVTNGLDVRGGVADRH